MREPQTARAPVAVTAREALVGVIMLTGVAAVLRGYALGANSLWVDEFATLVTARQPLARIPEVALHGDAFEPPLYFWATHGILAIFGESETSLRSLSAIAGVLTVPLMWLLLQELGTGPRAAALAAGLLAINPLHLWYSQEARPYALLLCFGALALVALARAIRTDAIAPWSTYSVASALVLLTHITGVVIPATGLVWVLLGPQPRRSLRGFVLASVVTLALISPFVWAVARAVATAQGTGSPPRPITGLELPYTLFTFVAGYSFGPAVREIQDYGWTSAVSAHWGQVLLALALLALTTSLGVRPRSRAALAMATLATVPLLATFLGAVITTKAYNVRYTLPALVGVLGMIALERAESIRRLHRAAIVLAAGIFLTADVQWFRVPRYWKEDSRAAVNCLDRLLPTGSRVLVAPSYMVPILAYYADRQGARLDLAGIPDSSEAVGPEAQALVLTRLHHSPRWSELTRSFESTFPSPIRHIRVTGYFALLRGEGASCEAPS